MRCADLLPIPSPALPLKGREIGAAPSLKGREGAFELLDSVARAHPRGLAGVAEELGYSRTALSRYVAGSYGEGTRLEAAILSRYNRRLCNATGEMVPPETCLRALRPKPFGGAARGRLWAACQVCIYKPNLALPIPLPASPLKGEEVAFALPLKGEEVAFALPLKGEEVAFALPLKGEEVAFALPLKGMEIDFNSINGETK